MLGSKAWPHRRLADRACGPCAPHCWGERGAGQGRLAGRRGRVVLRGLASLRAAPAGPDGLLLACAQASPIGTGVLDDCAPAGRAVASLQQGWAFEAAHQQWAAPVRGCPAAAGVPGVRDVGKGQPAVKSAPADPPSERLTGRARPSSTALEAWMACRQGEASDQVVSSACALAQPGRAQLCQSSQWCTRVRCSAAAGHRTQGHHKQSRTGLAVGAAAAAVAALGCGVCAGLSRKLRGSGGAGLSKAWA